jgi:putative sterol carrier protein
VTTKPTELLSKKVPATVNAAFAELKGIGDQGDADAKQRYADLATNPGAAHIVLEGKGGADLYLSIDGSQLRADTKPPSVPVLFAIAVAAEAFELALEEVEDKIEPALARLQKRLLRLNPKKARAFLDQLAGEKLKFHLVIKDTPDFDEVRVKIATGSAEPPAQPTFTVTLDYDTLEQLRERKIKPQAVLSKLKLSGDSARAMQLGMELMQRRGS